MPVSRRYSPEHPQAESCLFGFDFSPIIPRGITLQASKFNTLGISTNTVPPAAAEADWVIGPLQVRDRIIYANLSGGIPGTDYLLTWTAIDSQGNIWQRTAAVLCAATS